MASFITHLVDGLKRRVHADTATDAPANPRFAQTFETYAPELIWSAVDHVGEGIEHVEMIWIHVICFQGVSVTTQIYKVGDQIVTASALHKVLPDRPRDNDRLRDFFTATVETVTAWEQEVRPQEFPTRMILRFRPADQDMHADFFYGDPRSGLPEPYDAPISHLDKRWIERLIATGEDSASF